jgi:hypothetical protein
LRRRQLHFVTLRRNSCVLYDRGVKWFTGQFTNKSELTYTDSLSPLQEQILGWQSVFPDMLLADSLENAIWR